MDVTVAVKVTDCPTVDGFGEELSVVLVGVLASAGVADASPELAPAPSALVAATM
jgi:hypothetical protein